MVLNCGGAALTCVDFVPQTQSDTLRLGPYANGALYAAFFCLLNAHVGQRILAYGTKISLLNFEALPNMLLT